MFQLWFISISSDEDAFEYVTNTFIKQASFDKAFSKFYTGGKVSSDTAANIVREISQKLKKFNPQLKKKLSGMWCLALSPDANDVKKRQYHFFQQEPYLIYTKDSDINVDGNKIKEVFEKKFPTIKQAILGTEKALRKDVKGIAKGIIDGTAYQSEIQKQEDFPKFT